MKIKMKMTITMSFAALTLCGSGGEGTDIVGMSFIIRFSDALGKGM